ncbi:MAG: hypothetical protein R6V19_08020 [Armatimonadota bacterium]
MSDAIAEKQVTDRMTRLVQNIPGETKKGEWATAPAGAERRHHPPKKQPGCEHQHNCLQEQSG